MYRRNILGSSGVGFAFLTLTITIFFIMLTARHAVFYQYSLYAPVKVDISVRIRRNAARNMPGTPICFLRVIPLWISWLELYLGQILIISICLYRLHACAFWQFLEENSSSMNEDRSVRMTWTFYYWYLDAAPTLIVWWRLMMIDDYDRFKLEKVFYSSDYKDWFLVSKYIFPLRVLVLNYHFHLMCDGGWECVILPCASCIMKRKQQQ